MKCRLKDWFICCTLVVLFTSFGNSLLVPGSKLLSRIEAGPITLSQMGCGTWSWGNRLLWNYDTSKDEDIYEAYRLVRDAGVTVFDTADSYGTFDLNGRAEILLGQFERRYLQEGSNSVPGTFWDRVIGGIPQAGGGRANMQQIATKFAPYPWRLTRGSFVRAAQESLARLQQSKLEIAQLHWSTKNYLPQQEPVLWEGLADIYDAGLANAVGVSNYGPLQLQRIASRLTERRVPLATAQVQYSLMTFVNCRDMNAACDAVGCRLISYSPLCLGLLTGKYNVDNLPPPGNPRRQLFRELLPGAKDLLSTLDAVAKEYNKSMSQVAINWAICKGTIPIPGCRAGGQARGVLGSVGWKLAADAVAELDRVALNVKKPMIQNIFATD